jgi:hypothetical protein
MAKHPTVMSTLLKLQAEYPGGMRFLCLCLPATKIGAFIGREIRKELGEDTLATVVRERSDSWREWLACGRGEIFEFRMRELRRRWLAAIIARKPTKKTFHEAILSSLNEIADEEPTK